MNSFLRFIALSVCTAGYVKCQVLNPCVPADPPLLGKCPCTPEELGLKRPHPEDCVKYFECEVDGSRQAQFEKSCSVPHKGFDTIDLVCKLDPICFSATSPSTETPDPGSPPETTPDPGSPPETTPNPLECPPSGEVNIPDERDCNSYIRCVDGEGTPSQCPPGWTFDHTSLQCVLYEGICWPGASPPTGTPGSPPLPTDPTTTTPRPPTCPPTGELNIPDIRDCNGYTQCLDGVETPKHCPAGWVFDHFSRQCLSFSGTCWPGSSPVTGSPATFNPIDESTPSPPNPTFTTQTPSSETPVTVTLTPTTTIVSSTTEASGSICPPDVYEFLLPHPSDCSKYYLCIYGEPDLRSCTAGNFFDFMTKRCVPRANANCISGIGSPVCLSLCKSNLLLIILLLIWI